MRQHAIPQNILDIEFKLFTKFTVREFVYMAIGIGFGGIFLYFFTLGQVPGIIAFPVFLFSSGTGLFLGLVNINDQNADIFLRNYFWAITHPTQRVWKNTMIDEKFEQIKPEFNVTQGSTNRGIEAETNKEIIGGTTDQPATQFIENKDLEEIDREEQERLQKITELAQSTMSSSTPVTQQQTPVAPAQIAQPTATPIQQVPITTPPAAPTPIAPPKPQNIRIDRNNLATFQTTMSKPLPLAGNLNFKVVDSSDQPVSQAILIIKDAEMKIVSALQSDANGEVYSNKPFPLATYTVAIQSQNNTFPMLQIVLDSNDINGFKITAN